jgi:hypothetical protein
MQAATTPHEATISVEMTEIGTHAFLDIGEHQDLVVLGRADLLRLREQVAAALLAVAG